MSSFSYRNVAFTERINGVLTYLVTPLARVVFEMPNIRLGPVEAQIDTGATITRLSTEISHFLFSSNPSLPSSQADYHIGAKHVIVETGAGPVVRYRRKLASLKFLDYEDKEILELNEVIVNCPPPSQILRSTVLGMNILSLLKSVTVTRSRTTITW